MNNKKILLENEMKKKNLSLKVYEKKSK